MENKCLVSIIVPVHNTADYLHKCIESLRSQTLQQVEIILVDNLSVDGSSEICDEYAKTDMRIASAPYIGFVDSDDYVEPAMFEKMLDAMVQSDAEIAYCNFLLEYEFKPNESPYRNSGDIVIRDPKNVLQDMMMEKVSCSACTKLYKSDFLTSLQFPEGKNYEDRLVMYEWVALCNKVVWVDSPFYHYVERFEEEDLFKIRTRLIGTCLTIFKEILLKVNLREFKEPVKDMRQKMKEIAALPEDTYELKYRRRVRKIAYHWHLYYLTHFLFKKGGDS